MRVIGTAGHVDHGKSTLVKRLTGIDPDRLAEEKKREMTIDLGFAWLTLPDGEWVGVVDVPGHRDFIENMLAGVGGIDAVLFVIAADEGIMPQTREHLAILDLLNIHHGLIVLTKIDTVDDPDWVSLVEQEIQEAFQSTSLETAEIIRVSAHTGEGIPTLIEKLAQLLSALPRHIDYHHPRLPVDRVFTISGFGTVVTGTLTGGSLHVGNEIELQPIGLTGRIRGLQSHQESIEMAYPGSRVAVNISGIDKQSVQRGHVLCYPEQLQPTSLIDVHFRHLADSPRPLRHNQEVKVFSGAAEAIGHVRLLADEKLLPGGEGWLQIRLQTPMALTRGDRFILRFPSPGETIGGGVVINPHPEKRWRRFQNEIIFQLETQMRGTPAERITQAAMHSEPVKQQQLQKEVGCTNQEFVDGLAEALKNHDLTEFSDNTYLATSTWQYMVDELTHELVQFHQMMPLRLGMPREALRSRLGLKNTIFNLYLERLEDLIITEGNLLRLADHQIRFSPMQKATVQTLMQQMQNTPYTPPSYQEAAQITGEEILHALIELGEIVQVQPDVIFSRQVYDEFYQTVFQIIDAEGSITAAALRDRFNTTRKYAIGFLEHLDALGLTRREGDKRIRGKRSVNVNSPL
jgi:selenocysteine-specific elongation factor